MITKGLLLLDNPLGGKTSGVINDSQALGGSRSVVSNFKKVVGALEELLGAVAIKGTNNIFRRLTENKNRDSSLSMLII